MSLIRDMEHLLGSWTTAISNRVVDADPELRARLNAMDGRFIELNCTNPPAVWHLAIRTDDVIFSPGSADQPNVVVTGSAANLIRWLTGGEAQGITIDGDDTTLLETLDALRSFDPDTEDALGQVFGEQFTQTIVAGAEAGLKALSSIAQGMSHGLKSQTAERFVHRDHLDGLLDEIDELRLRVDRLSANVARREREASQ